MGIFQTTFQLKERARGFHLITDEIELALPEIQNCQAGILNLFIQHTSASLAINENADPSVRVDLESTLNRIVPENQPHFTHTYEGPDDMPAHIKAAILGASINLPITNGRLNLGLWQGIYLCEHRNQGGPRNIVASLYS